MILFQSKEQESDETLIIEAVRPEGQDVLIAVSTKFEELNIVLSKEEGIRLYESLKKYYEQ